MQEVIAKLEGLLADVPKRFVELDEEAASLRPLPEKWSKKEIIGHLCDSAINNLQRFIRAQFEPKPFALTPYAQNEWVLAQRYADIPTEELLALWVSLNTQIVRVISGIMEEQQAYLCVVGDEPPFTLGWLIEDYVVHMEHHLKQIFGE